MPFLVRSLDIIYVFFLNSSIRLTGAKILDSFLISACLKWIFTGKTKICLSLLVFLLHALTRPNFKNISPMFIEKSDVLVLLFVYFFAGKIRDLVGR